MEESKSLAKMGESVYQSNKDWLEKEHMGKIVALSKEGVAGVGDEILDVYEKAKEKAKGPFYFRRVGPNPSVSSVLPLPIPVEHGFDCLVGMNVMNYFRVTFDNKQKMLEIE